MVNRHAVSSQALVTDIVPDSKVRAAMNDINASQRLRCGHGLSSSRFPRRGVVKLHASAP